MNMYIIIYTYSYKIIYIYIYIYTHKIFFIKTFYETFCAQNIVKMETKAFHFRTLIIHERYKLFHKSHLLLRGTWSYSNDGTEVFNLGS